MTRIYVVMLSYVCGIIVLLISTEGSCSSTSTAFINTTTTITTTTTTTTTTSNPKATDKNSKRLALIIFLPLYLFCYGGACALYCIHKILRHCFRRKPGKMMLPLDHVIIDPLATPVITPAPMHAKIILKISSSLRPPSAGKRVTVYPAPPPTDMAGPQKAKVPPSFATYQHTSVQPIKKDPMTIFEDDVEPVTVSNVQVAEDPPPMYTDKREERRARLLESATKESRERQQEAAEEGRPASRPFTAPKRPEPETPPKAEEASTPENTGSTTNLVSQAKPPAAAATIVPLNMSGMSIRDILRMKQQATQKRIRKILAA